MVPYKLVVCQVMVSSKKVNKPDDGAGAGTIGRRFKRASQRSYDHIGELAAITLKSAFTGLGIGETAAFGTLLLSQVPHRRSLESEHQ